MEENNNDSNMRNNSTAALFGFPSSNRAKLEQTLCVVKPDAIDKADEIVEIIRGEGFNVLQTKKLELNQTQASQFLENSNDNSGSLENVSHFASGGIMAIVLSGPGALQHLNEILGPETYKHRKQFPGCLRHRFGTKDSDIQNGLHGSASESDAIREMHFFFPELIIEPILVDCLASYYTKENVQPVLMVGLSELLREKPQDPVLWLADWLASNNPNINLPINKSNA